MTTTTTKPPRSARSKVLLLALAITLIWSASWVLIKVGLDDIPALTFAGLRYTVSAICLMTLMLATRHTRAEIKTINRRQWIMLFGMGVVLIAVAQGAQFGALERLPAATLSLILNFTTVMIAVMSTFMLREAPTRAQIIGIGLYVIGMLIYFGRVEIDGAQALGLGIALICLTANAFGSILMRAINRTATLSPLVVTSISMCIGAAILLVVGIGTSGLPELELSSWLIIIWLGVVHTALAFTLWNGVMRVLTAIEASLINSLVAVFIAPLAWIFLGEALSAQGIVGLLIAIGGVMLVQISGLTVTQNLMQRAIRRVIGRKSPIMPTPPL